ncbi:hypothetical protein AVEN_224599-1 [Araneus ventricosus]|uniref:Serine/threonine-protein kinase ATR-like N-HEAT region domain-containing protein n=1 Tax=Araneus ventricosus TaxID=182803 RepID=A0A4Y2N840_ARAVE|nr:hypothetical protein AVEN_224599-1 [Araneus ventricosus]
MDYPVSQHMNKDHDDFSDRKFRETLNITIINNFLDLKASTSASNHATLSAFFHHMRNSFKEIPHIFVASPVHHDADENRQEKVDICLSTAFTEWLMMWLLHVLSDPCATSVHKDCKDLFFYLLQLIKFNNTFNFRHCVIRLIDLLSELNGMVDRFVDGNAEVCRIENYFYSDEKLKSECAQELDLVMISISFSTPDECEALQEKITSLLEMLIIDITQFLPDQCNNLCKILCNQIELGELSLKKESVTAIASLVREHGLMFSVSNINYLFGCLQAITLFVCTFEESVFDVFRSLEDAVSLFLKIMIEKVDKPESKYMLTTSTLGKTIEVLSEAATGPRFLDSTECFQSSVVAGIIFFLQHGKENGYSFPLILQEHLSNFVVTSLGSKTSKSLQHLAVHLIKTEGKNYTFGTNQSMGRFEDGQEKLILFENMRDISETWLQFYKRLIYILNTETSDKVIDVDLVCSYTEILLRSYCELHHIEKFEFQEFSLSESQLHVSRRRFPPLIIDSFNAHAKYLLINHFSSTYEKIITFYKQVLLLQDLLRLTDEHYGIICNILSIPWTLEEVSRMPH